MNKNDLIAIIKSQIPPQSIAVQNKLASFNRGFINNGNFIQSIKLFLSQRASNMSTQQADEQESQKTIQLTMAQRMAMLRGTSINPNRIKRK